MIPSPDQDIMESTQVFQKPIKLNFGSKTYTFKTDSEVLKVAQEYSWTEKCDFFEDFCRTFVDRNKVESSDPYYYAYIVKVIIEHSRCDAIHLSFPDYRNYKWL